MNSRLCPELDVLMPRLIGQQLGGAMELCEPKDWERWHRGPFAEEDAPSIPSGHTSSGFEVPVSGLHPNPGGEVTAQSSRSFRFQAECGEVEAKLRSRKPPKSPRGQSAWGWGWGEGRGLGAA